MLRMKDIAERAGVSVSTVSRALNNNKRISKAQRVRISEIAKEMGYKMNPQVQALMATRRSKKKSIYHTLAFLTDYEGEAHWSNKPTCVQTYEGVKVRARELGYGLDIICTKAFRDTGLNLNEVLQARGITAAILGFADEGSELPELDLSDLAIVGLSGYYPSMKVDRVCADCYGELKLALKKLRALGYAKVATAVPFYNNQLLNGLWHAAALEDMVGRPEAEQCMPFIYQGETEFYEKFKDWYEAAQPDAIIFYKLDVAGALAAQNIKVPEQTATVEFFRCDQVGDAAGILCDYRAFGAVAVDKLVSKIQLNSVGNANLPLQTLLGGTWVAGTTV